MSSPKFARKSVSPLLGVLGVSLGTIWPLAPVPAQVLAPKPGAPAPETAAPLSLTGSDGTGLELVSLSAQAVVDDPLAFTELHLIFRNPENRTREGRFRITLPSGATISRFAMRVGDRWQEGEVVEQQAARVAYEDFLHRRQDPALLETEAGNEFSARVFPIPPAATTELIVSYSQELTRASEPYRLPLRGLPKVSNLSIRALIDSHPEPSEGSGPPATGSGGGPASARRAKTITMAGGASASSLGGARVQRELVEVNKRDFRPGRDFEVAHTGARGRLGLRDQNLVVARIVPVADSDRRDDVSSLLVLIDTSASRALGLGDQVAAWDNLLAELRKVATGGDPMLTIAAFDQEVAPIYTGRASALGDVVRRRITERRALGASDLDRALRWAADSARATANKRTRVLLVTDGVATAGETGAAQLRQRVKALAGSGVERLDVLAVGGIREDALLTQLVTAGLARDGVVLDATQPAAALAHRLTRATRSGIKLEVDGAGWIWPNTLNGVQPGDEVLVYADLPPGKPLTVKANGKSLALAGTLAPVDRPLLERAWVKARIARLLDLHDRGETGGADPDMKDVFKKQAIELSIKNRVLCPYTSLLVLESEQDYARFGIERRALADVITVGAGGIELLHRSDAATAIAASSSGGQPEDQAESAVTRPVTGQLGGKAKGDRFELKKAAPVAEKAAKRTVQENVAASNIRMKEESASADLDGVAMSTGSANLSARDRGEVARAQPAPVAAATRAPEPAAAPPSPVAMPAPARARRDAPVYELEGGGGAPSGNARPHRPRPQQVASEGGPGRALAVPPARHPVNVIPEPQIPSTPPLDGTLREVDDLIHRHNLGAALAKARDWREQDPGDVLALVALGECGEASSDLGLAARAYGSIIDLFPGRADMRRFAGERLERVRGAASLALAVDTYRKAVEQRPDHPASHRLLAFALLKQGHPREAFQAIVTGAARRYPDGRFAGVDRILREDVGLIAAAWTRAEPGRAGEIRAQVERAHGTVENAPSVRFVLNWETDANDVDFHIHDGRGGHAYYGARQLASGGELYADVTTGYGPECFTIRGPAAGRAFPYALQAHYYSRGPMGYGMGKLQVIEHDGHGGLHFDERPFVIMQDHAFVDLGVIKGSALPSPAAVATSH